MGGGQPRPAVVAAVGRAAHGRPHLAKRAASRPPFASSSTPASVGPRRNPCARGLPLLQGHKAQAEFVVIDPEIAIGPAEDRLGPNRLHVLRDNADVGRSEEHTSELQSHSFISYAVFCLKK